METWTRVRLVGAQVLWVLCSLAALFLALGALLVAFQAHEGNGLVKAILRVADIVDLGVFDRTHGLKQWTSENAHTKNALFNWGLGALAWIVIGLVVDRVAKPSVTRK